MSDLVYDIEVLPNVFTFTAINVDTLKPYVFEISPRKNDMIKLVKFMNLLALKQCRMIGFNNVHYDYPVMHHIVKSLNVPGMSASKITSAIYLKSKAIFKDSVFNPFAHTIWDNQCIVDQIDLFKIHHFDNKARMTSLKRLQFNMRLPSIQEFEIPFDENVTKSSVIDKLLTYNKHDVTSTIEFLKYSLPNIKLREEMSAKQGTSYMNYNDTKIGEEYFVSQLKKQVGEDILFTTDSHGKRKKMTTPRDVMKMSDLIFDVIDFKTPKFRKIFNQMKSLNMFSIKGKFHWNEHLDYPEQIEVIKDMKATLKHTTDQAAVKLKQEILAKSDKYVDHHLSCELDGVTFEFGKGGLHGTLYNEFCDNIPGKLIIDLDVTSYYPSIGIENGLYPEHLTPAFCPVYSNLKTQRLNHPKGTTENAMFKLALNGSYGKTNSNYSVLCDPLYTVTTTVNGQLLLCMLWEDIRLIPNIRIIQANTDGITIEIDDNKESKATLKRLCKSWEKRTKMDLESAVYTRMWIRDGNNYIAEYKGGKLKTKGAYNYRSLYNHPGQDGVGVEWHKNHSMLVVKKAVEAELVHGIPADKFIVSHTDIYDFFLCTNVPRTCDLMVGDGSIPAEKFRGSVIAPSQLIFNNRKIQRVTRYLISNSDDRLTKVMPPLKGKTGKRFIGINVGYNVSIHNDIPDDQSTNPNEYDYDINYEFYINEAKKLLEPFK